MQAEDLSLLCKRHATSKLQKYEDLTGISTLGFRGEALASISCMSHLSVVTRHTGSAVGLKASYRCATRTAMCFFATPFVSALAAQVPGRASYALLRLL